MCLLWNYYEKNFESSRLLWRKLGEEPLPSDDEEFDVGKARQKEKAKGKSRTGKPWELPTPVAPKDPSKGPAETPKGIDPGMPVVDAEGKLMEKLEDRYPRLRATILKLYEIGNEEFWNQNLNAIAGDYAADYTRVAELMPETMLYKAIVENWSEETLYSKYRQEMGDLYTKAASRPFLKETWGQTKRAWHWAWESENPGEPGINIAIEGKRKISLRERPKILARMMQLENELINGDDICLEWKGKCKNWEDEDDVDEDRLKFIREELVPFYREWYLNMGIVENHDTTQLYWAWSNELANLCKSCEKP